MRGRPLPEPDDGGLVEGVAGCDFTIEADGDGAVDSHAALDAGALNPFDGSGGLDGCDDWDPPDAGAAGFDPPDVEPLTAGSVSDVAAQANGSRVATHGTGDDANPEIGTAAHRW